MLAFRSASFLQFWLIIALASEYLQLPVPIFTEARTASYGILSTKYNSLCQEDVEKCIEIEHASVPALKRNGSDVEEDEEADRDGEELQPVAYNDSEYSEDWEDESKNHEWEEDEDWVWEDESDNNNEWDEDEDWDWEDERDNNYEWEEDEDWKEENDDDEIDDFYYGDYGYYESCEVDEFDEPLDGEETAKDIWCALGCNEIFESPRPIHSTATWAYMRNVYLNTVGMERASILADHKNGTGFHKKITAKQSEGMGRGLFASEFIAKGELVWSATHTARFDSGDLYRQFLRSIPADLACDVMQWGYVQNITSLRVSLDLDEGALMNSDDDEPNIGCLGDAERLNGHGLNCMQNFFAIRDIPLGEELLTYYGDFSLNEAWAEFGL